jgi:hypothetical protein
VAGIYFTLSENGKTLEKHTITKATMIYARDLYHRPLVFKEVTKPISTGDIYFAKKYERKYNSWISLNWIVGVFRGRY